MCLTLKHNPYHLVKTKDLFKIKCNVAIVYISYLPKITIYLENLHYVGIIHIISLKLNI